MSFVFCVFFPQFLLLGVVVFEMGPYLERRKEPEAALNSSGVRIIKFQTNERAILEWHNNMLIKIAQSCLLPNKIRTNEHFTVKLARDTSLQSLDAFLMIVIFNLNH